MKHKAISKSIRSFDELLDKKYGRLGTKKRGKFEAKAKVFVISATLKAARLEAEMTQEQLAEKIGTKKSYISRLENGKADIQLSTLFKIFEQGLGRRIFLEIK
jgi:DNA-binding XRE family transcriptional regulator